MLSNGVLALSASKLDVILDIKFHNQALALRTILIFRIVLIFLTYPMPLLKRHHNGSGW